MNTAATEGLVAVNDQVEAAGKQLSDATEKAVTHARQRAAKAAKTAQKAAADRGAELSAEASTRSKALAKKGAKKGEQALERAIDATRERGADALLAARERGGEALLSALESEPGKRVAGTPAGAALKSKLTARKRRRKKILLLLVANAGGAIAFQQIRSRREAARASVADAAPDPTDVQAPAQPRVVDAKAEPPA
jgi:hypothetical protein